MFKSLPNHLIYVLSHKLYTRVVQKDKPNNKNTTLLFLDPK